MKFSEYITVFAKKNRFENNEPFTTKYEVRLVFLYFDLRLFQNPKELLSERFLN